MDKFKLSTETKMSMEDMAYELSKADDDMLIDLILETSRLVSDWEFTVRLVARLLDMLTDEGYIEDLKFSRREVDQEVTDAAVKFLNAIKTDYNNG